MNTTTPDQIREALDQEFGEVCAPHDNCGTCHDRNIIKAAALNSITQADRIAQLEAALNNATAQRDALKAKAEKWEGIAKNNENLAVFLADTSDHDMVYDALLASPEWKGLNELWRDEGCDCKRCTLVGILLAYREAKGGVQG